MKRILTILLVLCMICMPVCAESLDEQAERLYSLGLLRGVGNTYSLESLEPERAATRTEISVTLLRLLGKEEKANYQQNPHPFNDVPSWANASIGWLYENYYVNGVSNSTFGASDTATVQQFAAMCLRALGYIESQGDFAYNDALSVAYSLGICDDAQRQGGILYRKDMIKMCYSTLCSHIKDSSRTLASKLCDEGVFSKETAMLANIFKAYDLSSILSNVPDGLCNITYENGTVSLSPEVENYGLRVFYMGSDGVFHEAKMQKGEITYTNGGAAGMLSELYVSGISKGASLIVVKTSSEGAQYKMIAKSNIVIAEGE